MRRVSFNNVLRLQISVNLGRVNKFHLHLYQYFSILNSIRFGIVWYDHDKIKNHEIDYSDALFISWCIVPLLFDTFYGSGSKIAEIILRVIMSIELLKLCNQ